MFARFREARISFYLLSDLRRAGILAVAMLLLSQGIATAHDWYGELKTPNGGSCCGNRDCKPVDFCVTDKGTEGLVLAPGTCSPIDWSKVLRLPSPDGQAHACTAISRAPPGVAARCIVLPGEA